MVYTLIISKKSFSTWPFSINTRFVRNTRVNLNTITFAIFFQRNQISLRRQCVRNRLDEHRAFFGASQGTYLHDTTIAPTPQFFNRFVELTGGIVRTLRDDACLKPLSVTIRPGNVRIHIFLSIVDGCFFSVSTRLPEKLATH